MVIRIDFLHHDGNNGGSSVISLCAHVPIQHAYTLFLRLPANVEYDSQLHVGLHIHVDEITVASCGSYAFNVHIYY